MYVCRLVGRLVVCALTHLLRGAYIYGYVVCMVCVGFYLFSNYWLMMMMQCLHRLASGYLSFLYLLSDHHSIYNIYVYLSTILPVHSIPKVCHVHIGRRWYCCMYVRHAGVCWYQKLLGCCLMYVCMYVCNKYCSATIHTTVLGCYLRDPLVYAM